MLEWGRFLAKRILYLAWHLGFWVNGILGLVMILEQEFGTQSPLLPRWAFAALAIAGLLHGLIQSFVRRFYSRDLAREFLEILINTMLPGIPGSRDEAVGIRVNIMKLTGNRLRPVAWFRMENQKELELEWTIHTGCCGLAVRTRSTALGDMTEFKGQEYAAILHDEDKQPRWGLMPEHWSYIRDLGSVISIPLFLPGSADKVIGVLNIDARVGLKDWLPEPQLEEFLAGLQHQRGLLAWALQSGEY